LLPVRRWRRFAPRTRPEGENMGALTPINGGYFKLRADARMFTSEAICTEEP